MADPLSIAGSIVGLLTVAFKVCSTASNLINNFDDAPESIMRARYVVGEMRMILLAVQRRIDSLGTVPNAQRDMIPLDDLVNVMTHSVLIMSRVEYLIVRLDGLWSRVLWVLSHEKKIISLVSHLEDRKSALAFMLHILNR